MIVDDHPIWRTTLRNLLEQDGSVRVVAEAGDGGDAVSEAATTRPDVVVMDINLPTVDGIEATRSLLRVQPDVKVLVLASSDERAQVVRSVRSGASGYLIKTAAPHEVVEAVARLHSGELVFPPGLADIVLATLRHPGESSLPRVAIALPSVVERRGAAELLQEAGFEVVAAVGALEDLAVDDGPDVAIVDGDVLERGRDGSVGTHVVAGLPNVHILVLTRRADAAHAFGVLSQTGRGVGYMLKDRISDPDELVDAILRVGRGDAVVDPQVVNRLVGLPENVRSLDVLTPREREVLAFMAEGHSNQAIADRMVLGLKTVEAHVRNIFMKLGLEPDADVHRRVLAVIAYLRSG